MHIVNVSHYFQSLSEEQNTANSLRASGAHACSLPLRSLPAGLLVTRACIILPCLRQGPLTHLPMRCLWVCILVMSGYPESRVRKLAVS